jgi:hypothetical protein
MESIYVKRTINNWLIVEVYQLTTFDYNYAIGLVMANWCY